MAPSRIPVDVDRFTQVAEVPTETAYALLASTRTRVALHVLSTAGSRPSLERLATSVARLDPEGSPTSVRISLVHVVLPKLEANGVLEYELEEEAVHLDGPVVGLEEPIGTAPDATGKDGRGPTTRTDTRTPTTGNDGPGSIDARDPEE
ncbi:DUF7344 domain-containing protein [Natronorubrum tibetense]|uniref:DUF7344 domain-containing protein n=1 Tax=Natronorubrum tibetense GA33 TaxID=1114856 RepID=L9VXS0_9EURY|nr:hypothetical protein [Natronorubrum tibetense]ELY41018.1 hypothetical protein C496_10001 [Natronorubrum tibetense GA33]